MRTAVSAASKSPSVCVASAPSSRSISRVASAASDLAITAVCGFFLLRCRSPDAPRSGHR